MRGPTTLPTFIHPPFDAIPWSAQSIDWENAGTTETIRAATFNGAPTVPIGWRAWAVSMHAKGLNAAVGGTDPVLWRLRRNGVLVPGHDDFRGSYQHLSFTDTATIAGDFVLMNTFYEAGNVLPVPLRFEEGDSFSVGFRLQALPVFVVQARYNVWGWLEPLHVAREGLPGTLSR